MDSFFEYFLLLIFCLEIILFVIIWFGLLFGLFWSIHKLWVRYRFGYEFGLLIASITIVMVVFQLMKMYQKLSAERMAKIMKGPPLSCHVS